MEKIQRTFRDRNQFSRSTIDNFLLMFESQRVYLVRPSSVVLAHLVLLYILIGVRSLVVQLVVLFN